ncbi:MAG: DUF4962 domain-containing protein [Armatimonadia bacterium]
MRHLALLAAICAVSQCLAQEANLLTNPGFDKGTKSPEGWYYVDFKTGGTSVYDQKAGRSGTASVGVRVATDQQRGAWSQRLTISDRGSMYVSGWYRTEGLAARSGAGACLRMTYLRSTQTYDFLGDLRHFLPPAENWTPFHAIFPTPAGAKSLVVELLNFFVPGTVWWDDLLVRPATDAEVIQAMSDRLDQTPTDDEIPYRPEEGDTVSVSPPAFTWVPAPGVKTYFVQYSQDPTFAAEATTTVRDLALSVYTPTELIRPGKWYWRYGFDAGGTAVTSKSRSFLVPTDAVPYPRPTMEAVLAKIPAVRPRIYFTPESVAQIRAEAKGTLKSLADPVVRTAEKQIGMPLYPEPKWLPKDPQERSKAYLLSFQTMRPFTAGMETCALAYIITGDRRFAEEARRRLMHFSTWEIEGPSGVRHDDEAAMDIVMRGPRTFDWIYDTLSEADRKTCTDFLCKRLAQVNRLHRDMPFDSRPYSSHPGRMIGFMVEGTIVFAHEAPEATTWLDYYLRLLWSVYPAWGSDDGGWHEGISYWTAYLGMMTNVIAELDRLGIAWKDKPFLQNTGYFGLYCASPGRKSMGFGDGQEGAIGSGQGALLYALSSVYDNPYFRWYAEKTRGASAGGPLAFTLYRPDLKAKAPSDLPQARSFPRAGWVAMHSNMADPSSDVLLLLHSSPYGSTSHNHANQNAFVIEAFGEALAISSGYYQRYGSPHHMEWTWQTKAHNSILVDGEGQVPRSFASKGRIAEFQNNDGFCYATGDATAAYGGRLTKFQRHVLFCRPDYFVILDELESAKPSTFQWLLHAKSPMALAQAQQQVTISQGQARLRVQFLTPEGLAFTQDDKFTVAPDKADSPNQYHFTATTSAPASTVRILTVLTPYREGGEAALPACKLLSAEGGLALQVGQDLIAWKSPEAAEIRAGDLVSQAAVAAVRRGADGKVLQVYSVGDGEVRLAGAKP